MDMFAYVMCLVFLASLILFFVLTFVATVILTKYIHEIRYKAMTDAAKKALVNAFEDKEEFDTDLMKFSEKLSNKLMSSMGAKSDPLPNDLTESLGDQSSARPLRS